MTWCTVVPPTKQQLCVLFHVLPTKKISLLQGELVIKLYAEAVCFQEGPAYFIEPDLNSFLLIQIAYEPINPRF